MNRNKEKEKIAQRRLIAFRNMIESIDMKILEEDIDGACAKLSHVYAKTDDKTPPESSPDFVEGDAKGDLANMIVDLSQKLECN